MTALVVPNSVEAMLFQDFQQWKLQPALQSKVDQNGEIKGAKLNEQETASFLSLLAKYDIIIETVCIDTGMTTYAEIDRHRKKYASYLSQSQTGIKLNILFNQDALMSFSIPNFAQGFALFFWLLHKVLKISIPYYAQRAPQELGAWDWVIDAKDIKITTHEQILAHLVKPFLQDINFRDPIDVLEGENYSAMDRYVIPFEELLEPLKSKVEQEPGFVFSITEVMQNISYEQSHKNIGLKIVDILTNCIGRAVRGNLQFEGWRYISSLVVLRKDQAVEILRFSSNIGAAIPMHTKELVNYLRQYGKQMIVLMAIKSKITQGYICWTFRDTLARSGKRTTIEDF